jgi:hypothetical protein
MNATLPKGYQMEETLRRYFIKSGYYTVRGVPFVYQGFDVSDIDIWLYTRPSSVARHRIVVDCKNKTTPKAIERIFWTKGLQYVLGVEQAIVATTDKRSAVTDFGREHAVLILDGTFLSRLHKPSDPSDERLTEEQFTALISTYHPTKEGGDWNGRVKAAKRPLASGLGYNAINSWSAEARYFAEQAQLVTTHKEIGCRILYLLLSFIAVAFDFVMKDLAFSDPANKLAMLNDGLRYGSRGPMGTQQLVQLAVGLIEHYTPDNRALAPRIKERLAKDIENIPTRIVAEHFGKASVSHELFTVAKRGRVLRRMGNLEGRTPVEAGKGEKSYNNAQILPVKVCVSQHENKVASLDRLRGAALAGPAISRPPA